MVNYQVSYISIENNHSIMLCMDFRALEQCATDHLQLAFYRPVKEICTMRNINSCYQGSLGNYFSSLIFNCPGINLLLGFIWRTRHSGWLPCTDRLEDEVQCWIGNKSGKESVNFGLRTPGPHFFLHNKADSLIIKELTLQCHYLSLNV